MSRKNTTVQQQNTITGPGALFLRAIALLFLCIISAFFPYPVFGAGGDVLWQFGDAQTGKQETKAMAVDSAGSAIITGYQLLSGTDNDFYTIKVKADGSGIDWIATYNKAGNDDQAVAVAVDSNNDVIVTGFVRSAQNFDVHTIKYCGTTRSGPVPAACTKGDVLWQQTYNGAANGNDEATSVTVDSVNNLYVAGHSQNVAGNDDYLILKYSPEGTLLWQQVYNGSANGQDRITSITAGIDGVAVTGYSWNGTDFDCLTIKYGFDWTNLWEKRYSSTGTNDDRGLQIKMEPSGNVVVAGYASNGTNLDIYTAKYNGPDGTLIWQRTQDGGYDDEPRGLWIGAAGNVYVTGYAWTLTGHYDFYTVKYNGASGVTLWEKTYNSGFDNDDIATGIVVDISGDVFVTGFTSSAGNYDLQTIKYQKDNGNQLWQASFNGSANKNDRTVGIGLTATGEVIVAGWSDMWTSGASDYDYYVIKYDPGLLNAPTGLIAEAVSTVQVNLSWSDNSSNEDGFRIERKIGELGAYTEIDTVGPDVTSYNSTGLTPDTEYYYRVRAYNAANGNSHYSNEANALTTIVSYQPPSWLFTYDGGGGDDYANAISVGPDNNPVVTGYSFLSESTFDYYTVKFNRVDGSSLWSARYDDPDNDLDISMSVSVDGNNNVLVSGYSSLWSQAAGNNTNDIYTIKYTSAGVESWHDKYDGPAHDDDRSTTVATAADGSNNFLVVGYGRNAAFNDDIYLIKYLTDDTRVWAATPYDRGGNDYPTGITFDASGNVFVTGYSHNGTNYDFFTRKYDGNFGNALWTDIFDSGFGNDEARAVAVDLSGNVYVTGYAMNSSGNQDFYTIKYNGSTGARIWERSFNGPANGSDTAEALRIDPVDGNIVVSGTSLSVTDNHDYHIIRYNSDGGTVWEKTLDRPANDDYAVAMGMDLSGNVCVAGNTNNGTDMDIMSVKYNYEGAVIGSTIYDGPAHGNDAASSVAINSLGEAFIAGHSINAGGNADYVIFKCAWDPIQVPTPFIVTPLYTYVDLTWTDNSTAEDGFHIGRKTGNCSSTNPWGLIYTAVANTTLYRDNGLAIEADYCYRVQTFKNNGEASRWIEKSVTTLVPPVPSVLSAVAVSTAQINLSWSDNTTGETGFRIERCADAGCDFSTRDTFTVGPDLTGYRDLSVRNERSYSYRVLAYKTAEWETLLSNTASATTQSLAAPTVLSSAAVNTTRVDLSWTDNATDETGFRIERCETASCAFAEIAKVGPDLNSYSDTTVCHSTDYSYRLKAINEGLATLTNSGGSSWTKRAPLNIANFQPDFQTKVVITYDADMQTDFDDLRFYDETRHRELPYLIESKTNGVSATVWLRTGPNNNISLYYGNASATSAMSGTNTFEFFDGFDGTGIDAGKWTVTNSSGFSVSGGYLHGANTSGRLTSIPTFSSGVVQEVKARTTTISSYGQMISGFFLSTANGIGWLNLPANTNYRNDGTWVGKGDQTPANNMLYSITVKDSATVNLQMFNLDTSSLYWNVGDISNAVSAEPIVIGKRYDDSYAGYGYATDWDWIRVRKYAATEPAATVGSEETVTFTETWETAYSNTSPAATPTPDAPVLTATRASEVRINLLWTDNTTDETGFEVLRCAGSGCTPTEPPVAVLAANTTTYSDVDLVNSTLYRYIVRAYKTAAGCSGGKWTVPGALSEASTLIDVPAGLTATAVNTTRIDLAWTALNTATETGFRIERCEEGVDCPAFSSIATTSPNANAYEDTSLCNSKTYTYRVKAVNEGLSNHGGGNWTRRAPLTIANFQQDFQTKVIIAYDADMQPDFDDIRFYDETTMRELSCSIESKTDGSSATLWIKTGKNNNIQMYYGNASATSSGDGRYVFEFFDDFSATGIDTGRWTVNDGTGFLVSGGYLHGTNTTGRLTSKTTFSSGIIQEVRAKTTAIAPNGLMTGGFYVSGSNNIGWLNHSAYPYYRNDGSWSAMGGSPAPANNMLYTIKVKSPSTVNLQIYNMDTSALYWNVGDVSNAVSSEPIVIGKRYDDGYLGETYATDWDWVRIRKYAATEPSVTVGAEVQEPSGHVFSGTWDGSYSTTATATTPAPVAPSGLTATAVSESQISLSWSDSNTDETGFKIEKKAEACSLSNLPFVQIVPLNDNFDTVISADIWNQRGILYDTAGVISQDVIAPPVDATDSNGITRITSSGGAVEFYTTSAGGGTATYNNSRMYLKTPDVLQGDFDMQLDYSLPDGQITPAQYHVYLRVLINFPTTTGVNNVYVERSANTSLNYYTGSVRVDGTTSSGSITTTDTSGKLRIKRVGSTISTYAWTGGAWSLLKEVSGASTAQATGVTIIQYAQRVEAVDLKASVDNFVLDVSNADKMTLNDTNLDSGVTYCYRLDTYKSSVCGWETGYSNSADSTTLAPPAPSALRAVAANTTQVDLSWNDNTGSESGFVIQRCTGIGCTDFSYLATVNSNVTSYSDKSVCNGTTFRYQVRATKTTTPAFDTAYSSPATVTVPVIGNILPDWDFENATTSWTGTAGTQTGTSFDESVFYSSAKSLKLSATGATLGRTQTVTVKAGAQYILSGYMNTSLTAGAAQCDVLGTGIDSAGIRIPFDGANNNAGWVYLTETVTIPGSATSVSVRCFADGSPQGSAYFDMIQFVPSPLIVLTATRASERQVNLAWTDSMNDETGFEILRCSGAGCTPTDPPVATVGQNITTYSDSWLVHSTTYRYVVRAYKTASCGWSGASLVAEASTGITAPTGLAATAANTTQVNLSWTDNTASETGLSIERCEGSGCSSFAPVAYVGPGTLSYSDTTVCKSTAYNYRVGSHSDGLSNSGSSCWTRRLPLTITNFQPDFLSRVVIAYDSDMQPDFDDMRFYDMTQSRELPYWIESKTDGSSATVWIKTGSNNDIYLYFGNAGATSSGSMSSIFGSGLMGFWQFNEPAGTISGTTSDISEKTNDATLYNFSAPFGIIGSGKFGNALSLNGSSTYVRRDSTNLPTGSTATIEAWIYPKGYPDATYNGIVSWGSRSCNGYALALSMQNSGRPSMATWCNDFVPSTSATATLNAWNHVAVVVSGTSVTLYMNGQPVSGTLPYTPNIQQNNLSIGALDFPGRYFNGDIDEVRIYNRALSSSEIASRYAATDPVITFGSKEQSACFTFVSAFSDQYSNTKAVTTPTPSDPSGLTATRNSEVQINLAWTDNTTDETGFKVESCMVNTGAGIDCTNPADFSQIATVNAAGAGTGTKTYNNRGLIAGKTYYYRVRAYKSGVTCGWDTNYSNNASATTAVTAPTISASAVNTTRVDLSWSDSASSETDFVIERCEAASCNFAPLVTVAHNVTSYSDMSVCNSVAYKYRVKSVNMGLIDVAGGCWTKRVPLTITNFQPDFETKMVVTYSAGMQPDFDDIRFYDEVAGVELPHWIESKTDSVSATVWFRPGASNNVYMYYGNASATSSSSGKGVFELLDDFRGAVIDSTQWAEIDPDNSIAQNNDLILNDVSDSWTKALISNITFDRAAGKKLYVKVSVPTDTAGNNHLMLGWELNQTTDPNYTRLVHGLYLNNYLLTTYEKGNSTGPNTQPYTASADYEIRIELKDTGAKYYIRGGTYTDWTLVQETSTYSDSPMRVAFTQYSHQLNVHLIAVQKYAEVEPSVTAGTEETSACYSYEGTWEGPYSNEASATTPSFVTPSGLSVTAVTDTDEYVSWTDANSDETGFRVERCTVTSGTECADFAEIDTTASDVDFYVDVSRTPSTSYCYRVRTYKTASCGWTTGYSNSACDLTFSAHPINLVATALNAFKIRLDWEDVSSDEDGFEIEVQIWNGKWTNIGSLGPGVRTFSDTMGIEPQKEYRYRVRSFRGADKSPYSNEANVTTPVYQTDDGTCL